MKRLFTFTLNEPTEVEEVVVQKNDKGEEIKVLQKVKKNKSHKFFLKKPNRSLFESAEFFYGQKVNEALRGGWLTRQLLVKRFLNDGGILSEPEKEEYKNLYIKLFTLQEEQQKINQKLAEERTDAEKKRLEEIKKEIEESQNSLIQYESQQSSLFSHTAETFARNRTIFWWVLQLAYKELEDGKEEAFFGEGSYEEKAEKYDEIEEKGDKIFTGAASRFVSLASFWYVGSANSEADFAEFYNKLEKEISDNEQASE